VYFSVAKVCSADRGEWLSQTHFCSKILENQVTQWTEREDECHSLRQVVWIDQAKREQILHHMSYVKSTLV
jgi:hypothetical protein